MFCLNCVPQIVPLLCPISSSTRFLLCALILCLCSLHLSPPKAELSGICHTQSNWAHLISISSLHRCTKINHSSPHSAEEELGYGHRTLVCHINQHSTPVPPGLCLHCSQGKDCPPGSSSVQLLAPQDRDIILHSYWTWWNTSFTAWPQTLAQLVQGDCEAFHILGDTQKLTGGGTKQTAARAGELAQMTSNASHSVIHIYSF